MTLPVALAWTAFAAWSAWGEFDPDSCAGTGLVLTSLYLLLAGIVQQALPTRRGG